MKNRGFTLVELLAVLTVLAIIALIIIPIVTGVVRKSTDESRIRSIELYATAIRNAESTYQLKEGKDPESFEDIEKYIDYNGNVVCETQELYRDGTIYLADCIVDGKAVDYEYGDKQEQERQIIKGKFSSVCIPEDGSQNYSIVPGTKYNCKVDSNKPEYTFYVLNSSEDSVNLIMDSNINISGEAVKSSTMSDKGFVAWYANELNNSYGPITAMDYLDKATKDWTNTNSQTISTFRVDEWGSYLNIRKTYITYARMPYLHEVQANGIGSQRDYPLWIIDYLEEDSNYPNRTSVSEVVGYWTLSKHASGNAWYVHYRGYPGGSDVNTVNKGVRPVITLSI